MRGASRRIALLGLAGLALGRRVPDAHHSSDRVGREVVDLPKLGNAATCRPRGTGILGPLLPTEELAGGLRKGATAGKNPAATDAAGGEVPGQLDALPR